MKVSSVKAPKVTVKCPAFEKKPNKSSSRKDGVKEENMNSKQETTDSRVNILDVPVSQLWEKMKSTMHSLQASTLTGRALKRFQQQELVRLGAKKRDRESCPSKILMGMRKKADKRVKREKELKRDGDQHAFVSDSWSRKHVQNKAIYNVRAAEDRKEKDKQARTRRYRK